MSESLKIFLSSTKVDLSSVRQNIIRFLRVLPSELIAMEVFGSDERKPVDFSLAQVRKCNMFIGVYAERYGEVDPKSGKSITELEYVQASKMLQAGKLKALLLYVVNPKARWPLDLIERDSEKMARLSRFKDKILSSHTVSFFRNIDDLPFLILRDVIMKIGIGQDKLFRAKKHAAVRQKTSLRRPVGMEYYGEDLARLFFGRDNELNSLEDQIVKHKMSLLIGSSGVGKTSLLCAGLTNRVKRMGWQTALVRPLTDPANNLKRFLWDQLLEGDLPAEFDLSSVVHAASTAFGTSHVLIIIDQFEDILAANEPSDIKAVTANLLNIFRSAEENLRILICYRGDAESEIGIIWQKISGSPQGLPRTYLRPLDKQNAKVVLESTLRALSVTVKESGKGRVTFIDQTLTDLETESFLSGYSGVYPPFMQMVIARIFQDKGKNGIYHSEWYYSAGQSKRIIADYLMNQLRYLGKNIEVGKGILIALVSSYGTKTQKTLEEISTESLVPSSEVERILNSLIDLRLVRGVNGAYEIAHDFLAKIISAELVSVEEREAKKFKDLLASRIAAYESTKAGLTCSEHLHVYRYRNKILCTDDEVKLLLESHLFGNGPISFWARRYPKAKLISWTQQLLSGRGHEIEEAAYRFLMKLGERPPLSTLAEVFSDYKQQHELSRYISEYATRRDIELLIKLNRKRAEEVAHASETALVKLVKASNKTVLQKMAGSKSPNTILAFEKIVLNLSKYFSLTEIRSGLDSKDSWRRLLSIYALSKKGNNNDFANIRSLLKSKTPQKIKGAVTKATVRLAIRLGNSKVLKECLSSTSKFTVEKALEAIDMPSTVIGIKDLFPLYDKYPFQVSKAIYSISTPADVPKLKRILSSISLDPPAREFVYALCKFDRKNEISFLLRLFLNYEGKIDFWNPFAVVNQISSMARKSHVGLLRKIIQAKEFWSYYAYQDRPKSKIPVKDFDNVYFIRRLAGTAFGKVAGRAQFPLIFKMLCHDYWTIWNAALEAIRRHGTTEDVGPLLETAIANPSKSYGLIEAISIIDEKVET